MSDTVGFIDRLPHTLVAAFRATLEEVAEADLVAARDRRGEPRARAARGGRARACSRRSAPARCRALDVFNKCDLLEPGRARAAAGDAGSGRAVRVGADRRGRGELLETIASRARARHCGASRWSSTRTRPTTASASRGVYRHARVLQPRDARRPRARSKRTSPGGALAAAQATGSPHEDVAAARALACRARRHRAASACLRPVRAPHGAGTARAPAAASFPDFVFPAADAGTVGTRRLAERHRLAWRWLQAGDLARRRTRVRRALKRPAAVHRRRAASATSRWRGGRRRRRARAVRPRPGAAPAYAPALVGRGEALLALGAMPRRSRAFEAAARGRSRRSPIGARRGAAFRGPAGRSWPRRARRPRAGRLDEARAAYEQAIAASPESAFLYPRAGGRRASARGDTPRRSSTARRPWRSTRPMRESHVLLGDMLEAQDDHDAALDGLRRGTALDPAPRRSRDGSSARASARPWRGCRRVPRHRERAADHAWRAGGAARRPARRSAGCAAAQRQAVLVTDVRGHWAAHVDPGRGARRASWSRCRTTRSSRSSGVRRGDLAQVGQPGADPHRGAVSRRGGGRVAGRAASGLPTSPPSHLTYPAVSQSRRRRRAAACGRCVSRRHGP